MKSLCRSDGEAAAGRLPAQRTVPCGRRANAQVCSLDGLFLVLYFLAI